MSGTGTHSDYSQNDPAWAGHLLGFSTWEKIGPFGCLETAFANVSSAQGQQLTVQQVNDALKAHGAYVRDAYGQLADISGYAALSLITPHSRFVEQQNWPGTVVAPASYFDVAASVSTEVIIGIDSHPEQSGVQWHYVRVVGLANGGKDITIVDSWDGQRKLLSTYAARKPGKTPFQLIWSAGRYTKV